MVESTGIRQLYTLRDFARESMTSREHWKSRHPCRGLLGTVLAFLIASSWPTAQPGFTVFGKMGQAQLPTDPAWQAMTFVRNSATLCLAGPVSGPVPVSLAKQAPTNAQRA